MATPFDEKSVDLCCALGIPIVKIASSDLNDWFLMEKIAKTKKPVIVSTGGSSVKDLDDLVTFFQNRNIPSPSTIASRSTPPKTANWS